MDFNGITTTNQSVEPFEDNKITTNPTTPTIMSELMSPSFVA